MFLLWQAPLCNFSLFLGLDWRAKKCCHASYTPKASSKFPPKCSVIIRRIFCLMFFEINGCRSTRKLHRINLFMGLCANTFTLVHSSFKKRMENIQLPGFSYSAPNLVSAKFRNVAGLKLIKLQNQYLNKKVLFSSQAVWYWSQSQCPHHRCQ